MSKYDRGWAQQRAANIAAAKMAIRRLWLSLVAGDRHQAVFWQEWDEA